MATHLSPELLEQIFQNFATPLQTYWGRTSSTPEHTFPVDSSYSDGIRRHRENRHQLTVLSLVSKQFCAVARPLLYNHVRLIGEMFYTCDTVHLFVRTLAFHIELRKFVRSLSIELCIDAIPDEAGSDSDAGKRWADLQPQEPGEYTFWGGYKMCLDALGMRVPLEDIERGDATSVAHQPVAPEHWNDSLEAWAAPEDVAAILLYWLSNLTKLQIAFEPGYDYKTDLAGIWRCKPLLECMRSPLNFRAQVDDREHALHNAGRLAQNIPAALLNISDLIVANPHEAPFWVKSTYPPVKFCSVEELEPFWCLPNTQSLTLYRIAEEFGPTALSTSSVVTRLGLYDCCLTAESLTRLLAHFPGIRSLAYSVTDPYPVLTGDEGWDVGIGPFLAQEAIHAILKHCVSLENLRFASLACQSFERVLWSYACAMQYDGDDAQDAEEEDDGSEGLQAVRARKWLSKEIGTVTDLRQYTVLKRFSCHMVDLVGWTPKWSQGKPVDVRIARVLPRNLQHLELRYDGLFGEYDNGFSETTFDHVRDLIQDCRELTLEEQGERWLPDLETVVLDVVDTWKHVEDEVIALQESASAKGIRLSWEWHPERGCR